MLKKKITKKTKAVIAVHLFGLCCDIIKLKKILPTNVKILEDAACSTGSTYNGKFSGNIGDAAAFEFHPRKIITTGEGGILSTNSKQIFDKINTLRNMGRQFQMHNDTMVLLHIFCQILTFLATITG